MSLFSNWPGATFTRSTEACYLTSATTTAVASMNTPRVENTGDGNSFMLFEGQNVNYAGGSEGTAWSGPGSGAWTGDLGGTIDSALQSDPDGTTNARLLHLPTSSIARIFNTLDSTGPGTGVNTNNINCYVCFWARVASGTATIRIKWQDRNLGATFVTCSLTTTWQRFTFAANTGTGSSPPLVAIVNDGTHAVDPIVFRFGVYISNFPPSDVRNITPDPFPTTSDADSLTFEPWPNHGSSFWYSLLWSAHQFTYIPKYGTADLNDGDEFWLYSYCSNEDGVRIRKSSGNVLVEALRLGTVRAASNALTFAREAPLVVKVDPQGQITVNGSAGARGDSFMTRMCCDLAGVDDVVVVLYSRCNYYSTPQIGVRIGGIYGATGKEAWGRMSEPARVLGIGDDPGGHA